jgi:CheY-like chemotaxis protein
VSLEQVPLFPEDLAHTYTLVPGEYNLLKISDTGTGIKPHLLERIFEPYFTTKPMNKGTGLGLSVVHGIVKSHGGEILAFSEDNKGATFHVYLPCIEERAATDDSDERGEKIPGGSEHLLVVDDDRLYLEMMIELLQNLGYAVTAAGDGEQALEMIQKDPARFDCLLTDMTMPGITGAQLALKILELVPDLPIIMFTGFSETINCDRAADMGIKAFLMKPVVLPRIAATLRSVLDKRNGISS